MGSAMGIAVSQALPRLYGGGPAVVAVIRSPAVLCGEAGRAWPVLAASVVLMPQGMCLRRARCMPCFAAETARGARCVLCGVWLLMLQHAPRALAGGVWAFYVV